MELPAIEIPQIVLPFEVPTMLHPVVDHFVIALPIIVLLLEIVNLLMKKRALGVTSFFLLLLTVVISAAAYLTGSVDGKEAFPLLSEVAQHELQAHKLLGTYVMLASAVVLFFKFFSVVLQRGLMKALYLLILVLFIAVMLKQGKDGGELVYKYGVNVQTVQDLSSEIDDLKEEIEEWEEKKVTPKEKSVPVTTPVTLEVKEKPVVEAIKKVVPEVVASPEITEVKELTAKVEAVVPVADTQNDVSIVEKEIIPTEMNNSH